MICVSISENSYEKCIEAIGNCKMAEIRMDLCKLHENDLKKIFSLPMKTIATCREGVYTDEKRTELLKLAIDSGATYIDIEIEAPKNYQNVLINYANKHNCKIIVSYHNFEETPETEDLQNIINDCFNKRADIAKIACKSNSEDDNKRILELYKTNKSIVAIGMGEIGKETRVKSISLGAPFTFASSNSGKQTADGQIDVDTLRKLLQ